MLFRYLLKPYLVLNSINILIEEILDSTDYSLFLVFKSVACIYVVKSSYAIEITC